MPKMSPGAYTTYQIAAPAKTHWRDASCAEVDCGAWLHGWRTVVDEATDLGASQAYYIRHDSGRGFTEVRQPDGLTAFTFEAGQRCFSPHRIQARPEFFVVRHGDWRRSTIDRVHTRPVDWVEDFALHQDKIATVVKRERG